MRFFGRDEHVVAIFDAETRQVDEQVMAIGHLEPDALHGVDLIEHDLSHRIQRVLNRQAVVLSKAFQQRLPDGPKDASDKGCVPI